MPIPKAILTTVLLMAGLPVAALGQDTAQATAEARDSAKQAAKDAERARKEAEEGPPATVTVAPLPRAGRPMLNVQAFRYGTVTNQANYEVNLPRGSRATVITDPGALAHEDNQNIGAGVAEMVKAELVKGESFRVLEGPMPTGRLVTGSITRFGGEDRVIGGAGLFKKLLGGIGLSKKRTVVELTAQVLDAATGEILLSITGFGMSRKGGGLVVIGGGKDGIAGGGAATTNFAATAIGEATRLAAQDLAAKITNARDGLIAVLKASARPEGAVVPQPSWRR